MKIRARERSAGLSAWLPLAWTILQLSGGTLIGAGIGALATIIVASAMSGRWRHAL